MPVKIRKLNPQKPGKKPAKPKLPKIKLKATRVIHDVLLRQHHSLRYCLIECPRHLVEYDYIELEGLEGNWQYLESFSIVKLIEHEQFHHTKPIYKVKFGGSYDITDLALTQDHINKRLYGNVNKPAS